ncbi:beta-defensin 110-like [Arvicola amphibius]|uniref:beta-defensin 110-like n=1 Tax=Arvicola amphibius TaxID=1047088 RepID=UPI001C08F8F2|nr:beta-defensin 110-like [Arvicola amphibius]
MGPAQICTRPPVYMLWLEFRSTFMSFFFLVAARSNMSPKYRLERCERVRGMCKTYCDEDEYDFGYCIKWRNRCCI